VPRPGRDEHRRVGLDLAGGAVDGNLAIARLDAKELIAVVVDLLADLLAGLERHQHQLKVPARLLIWPDGYWSPPRTDVTRWVLNPSQCIRPA
jgi:hypothetical protein